MASSPHPDPTHHVADCTAVRCAVVTVSDTRNESTDRGGALVLELLEAAGHTVADRRIVRDEPSDIRELLEGFLSSECVDAVLVTGGTGVSRRDQTCETVSELLTKPLPGYGELLRTLSYEEIGAKAMLSRAVGGVADATVVLTMPGSTAAVRLAMDKLILPVLGHLVREAMK